MGVSNWFDLGKKNVKNFIKAKLSLPKRKAGKNESPAFRKVGHPPGAPKA